MAQYNISVSNNTITVSQAGVPDEGHPLNLTSGSYNGFGDTDGSNDEVVLYLLGRDLFFRGKPTDFRDGTGAQIGSTAPAVKTYFESVGITRAIVQSAEDGTPMPGYATQAGQDVTNSYLNPLVTYTPLQNVAADGASHQLVAADPNGYGLLIVNLGTPTIWLNIGGAATDGPGSIPLTQNASFDTGTQKLTQQTNLLVPNGGVYTAKKY